MTRSRAAGTRIAVAAIVMMLGTAARAGAQEPTAPSAPSSAPSSPPATAPAQPAADPAAAGDASGSGRYDRRLELPSTQTYFDDASKLPIAPIIVQPDPPRRTRPTLWIGGLLVLAAIFLWNRSRRLDLERLEAAEERRSQRHAPDDDAVDLAAAAQARAGDDDDDGDPPEYNAAPTSSGAPASPAPPDSTEEPR